MKWMAPGDLAHGIGPVRHALALAECSGGTSMWGDLLSRDSEFQKLVMFLAVAQEPVNGS